MYTNVVIGALFGDEGKGKVVDYLCQELNDKIPLVIRFSGGHQCGHTVVKEDGKRHVFHSLGSGSLENVATFIGPDVVFFPPMIYEEKAALRDLGCTATLIHIDPMAMVATPYDIAWNRVKAKMNNHGSCGLGVGTTIERNLRNCKFLAGDLDNLNIINYKFAQIKAYYYDKVPMAPQTRELFISEVNALKEHSGMLRASFDPLYYYNDSSTFGFIQTLNKTIDDWGIDTLIFEGNQGALLDAELGFFPHVTRSRTTALPALQYLDANCITNSERADLSLVTRCYTTRHGNGPMMVELDSSSVLESFVNSMDIQLINNDDETNVTGEFQGEFRVKRFDPKLLEYSIKMMQAELQNKAAFYNNPDLYVTCLDHLNENDKDRFFHDLKKLSRSIEFKNIYTSHSASGKFEKIAI